MEWAVFEAKVGRPAMARQLFEEGSKLEPLHPPLLAAWAAFEASQQQWDEASRIQELADDGSLQGDHTSARGSILVTCILSPMVDICTLALL